MHTAKKIGAQVIAGVRKKSLKDAESLGVAGVVAIDDDDAVASLGPVDAIADTVGGEVAAKLFKKIKPGGFFGYASMVPEGMAAQNPTVTITRVFAKPDPSKVREFADDVRDGKFVLPIGRRLPLSSAGETHALGEKGGAGKDRPSDCRRGLMPKFQQPKPSQRRAWLLNGQNLKMAQSAHAYVRGNTAKFYEWLERAEGTVPDGPASWICGDCHVGTWARLRMPRATLRLGYATSIKRSSAIRHMI